MGDRGTAGGTFDAERREDLPWGARSPQPVDAPRAADGRVREEQNSTHRGAHSSAKMETVRGGARQRRRVFTSTRSLAVLAVLGFVSGLFLGAVDEAHAVSSSFASAPSSMRVSGSFLVDFTIPTGERLPIDSVEAVVEERAVGVTTKAGAAVVARAACDMVGVVSHDCPGDTVFSSSSGVAGAVQKIEFIGAFVGTPPTTPVPSGDAFDEGPRFVDSTGYGYDPNFGYGYGGPTSLDNDLNNGYGYGYAGESLFLRFQVDLGGCGARLSPGVYFLTVLLYTGIPALGSLSSPFTQFRVVCGGGGSSSVDDDATDGGGVVPDPLKLTGLPIDAPEGALAAYDVAFADAKAGQTLEITLDDPLLPLLHLKLLDDAAAGVVRVTIWPGSHPPPGVPDPPEGIDSPYYIQVEILGTDGVSAEATFFLTFDEAEATHPGHGVLLHLVDGVWKPEAHIIFAGAGDGSYGGSGSSPCCSDFLVGFDAEPIEMIEFSAPEGPWTGIVEVTSTVTDNLDIVRQELYVNGGLMAECVQERCVFEVPTEEYTDGEYTISVLAHSFVGRTDAESFTTDFDNEPDGTLMTGLPGWAIGLIAAAVLVVIGGVILFTFTRMGPGGKAPRHPER